MNLQELTRQESGIIIYGHNEIGVFNWMSCDEGELPLVFCAGQVNCAADDLFDDVEEWAVDDLREDLRIMLDEEGMMVIYDMFEDISGLLCEETPHPAKAYSLMNGNYIVYAPDGWN